MSSWKFLISVWISASFYYTFISLLFIEFVLTCLFLSKSKTRSFETEFLTVRRGVISMKLCLLEWICTLCWWSFTLWDIFKLRLLPVLWLSKGYYIDWLCIPSLYRMCKGLWLCWNLALFSCKLRRFIYFLSDIVILLCLPLGDFKRHCETCLSSFN